MATLGMMYPVRGGLVWGQIKGVLSEVRGLHPLVKVCITYWLNLKHAENTAYKNQCYIQLLLSGSLKLQCIGIAAFSSCDMFSKLDKSL